MAPAPLDRASLPRPGRLYGVGLGPGDPELMTVKAQRLLMACPVIVHFAAKRRHGNAWSIIEASVSEEQTVLRLEYPMTTEAIGRADYERHMAEFYDRCAGQVAAQLDAGRDVAVACEGDPFFYGSYMYIHQRLAGRYEATVVPGVTAFSAAAAAAGVPLVSRNETFTVLPGVLPGPQLAEALGGVDAAVIMKVGRHLGEIVEAADAAGLTQHAVYVERASCATERVVPLADAEGIDAPYFSLVLIPGRALQARGAGT